jgi:hypothetical protein
MFPWRKRFTMPQVFGIVEYTLIHCGRRARLVAAHQCRLTRSATVRMSPQSLSAVPPLVFLSDPLFYFTAFSFSVLRRPCANRKKLSLDATQTVAVAVRATSSQCSLPRTSVIIARIVELDEC